jgi:hypothetical protein
MATPPENADAPRSSREELRRAADHIYQAADDAVEVVMPRELRHHLRNAARHLLQAGVAAIDSMERSARMRDERRQRRSERPSEQAGRTEGAGTGGTAGSHTPGCL